MVIAFLIKVEIPEDDVRFLKRYAATFQHIIGFIEEVLNSVNYSNQNILKSIAPLFTVFAMNVPFI
jgi:hypothetical protein